MEKYYMEMSEVKNFIHNLERDAEYDGVKFTADYICDLIDFVPKERVKEYFIGEWIFDDSDEYGDTYKCSRCGFLAFGRHGQVIDFKFCPECGAEMKRRLK